jgi:hypothetical protein
MKLSGLHGKVSACSKKFLQQGQIHPKANLRQRDHLRLPMRAYEGDAIGRLKLPPTSTKFFVRQRA